jgi:hypothetical protein
MDVVVVVAVAVEVTEAVVVVVAVAVVVAGLDAQLPRIKAVNTRMIIKPNTIFFISYSC